MPILVKSFQAKVLTYSTEITPVCQIVFLFCHCRKGSPRQLQQHPSISRLEMVTNWGFENILGADRIFGLICTESVSFRDEFQSLESRHTLESIHTLYGCDLSKSCRWCVSQRWKLLQWAGGLCTTNVQPFKTQVQSDFWYALDGWSSLGI